MSDTDIDRLRAELGKRAVEYMADSMAMREPTSDQHQNWILGHLVTFAGAQLAAATERAERAERAKDGAYQERDKCVAALVEAAHALGCFVWRGYHAGENWDNDWRNVIFIELPTGQVSWHIHDSELPMFAAVAEGGFGCIWDEHTTPQKYERLLAWKPAHQPSELREALRRIAAIAHDYRLYDIESAAKAAIARRASQRAPETPERATRIVPLAPGVFRTNGGIRCDVEIGPCACGATHEPETPPTSPGETP